jgi:MFS transporter, OFA family, oxalate/formate antiporter
MTLMAMTLLNKRPTPFARHRYVAVLSVASGIFLCSCCKSIPTFCLSQAVYGAGIGIGYIAPLSCGYKHLPDRKGLVSGLIVGGFGTGSFVFNVVATQWVNPENEKVPDGEDYYPSDGDVAQAIPGMYKLLAAAYLVLGLLGSSLLSDPEEEVPLPIVVTKGLQDIAESDEVEEEEEGAVSTTPLIPSSKSEAVKDLSTREMMRTLDFYILICCFFCSGMGGMFLSATYKNFADVPEHLKDQGDHFFTYVGSIGSICNGLSRVFWGVLADKIGPNNGEGKCGEQSAASEAASEASRMKIVHQGRTNTLPPTNPQP